MNNATNKIENLHESVLSDETIHYLDVVENGTYVDATLGLGGHTEKILEVNESVRVIGIDQDSEAIRLTRKRLKYFAGRIKFAHANFSDLSEVLSDLNVTEIDGIIADLGVSSLQLDSESRGFSFRFDAPLDMRMNPDSEVETAADLLRLLKEEEIANLIYELGEERFSRRIARRIVERRNRGDAVKTTKDLANLVERAVPRKRNRKIHPATKTFQALRIAVNGELEILADFIREGVELLKTGGRLVVITFHSLEDRIVKRTMQSLAGRCFCPPKFPTCVCGKSETGEILTKKPVTPQEEEKDRNPRSRSAKLRAIQKK